MLPNPFALSPIDPCGANCQPHVSVWPIGSLWQPRMTATKGCERRHLGDESKRTPTGVERAYCMSRDDAPQGLASYRRFRATLRSPSGPEGADIPRG
jgi:hypothetical protein